MSTYLNLHALSLEASTSCIFINIPLIISALSVHVLNNCPSKADVDRVLLFLSRINFLSKFYL